MKSTLPISLLVCFSFLLSCKQGSDKKPIQNEQPKNEATRLIEKVCQNTGTYDDLKKLKNVSYTYVLDARSRGIKNISQERYIFDGEWSWAQYLPQIQTPVKEDTIKQLSDGKNVIVHVNSSSSDDPKLIEFATFIRKTNFYWFTMMQKLLDPGVNHKLLENRVLNGVSYKIVEITFGKNIGAVQDRYLLYVNPETHLVDQFLFTVKERNLAPVDPLIMVIEYDKYENVMYMTRRTVRRSDWDGKSDGDLLYEQHYEDVSFNNNFTYADLRLK